MDSIDINMQEAYLPLLNSMLEMNQSHSIMDHNTAFLLVINGIYFSYRILLLYAKWTRGSIEKMKLPVASVDSVFGNAIETFETPVGHWDLENFKKFGSIYVVYEGREPQIYVCDAELIGLITVTNADHFQVRRQTDFKNPLLNEIVNFQTYDKWKYMRNSLLPLLSATKTRRLCTELGQAMSNFSRRLKLEIELEGGQIHKYDLLNNLALVVNETFGIHYMNMDKTNPLVNELLELCTKLLVSVDDVDGTMEAMSWSFPHISRFVPAFFMQDDTDKMTRILLDIMAERRRTGTQFGDLVDYCNEFQSKLLTPEFIRLNMSNTTIAAQVFALFAGLRQINRVVAKLIYYLLLNPKSEKIVFDEIDSVLSGFNDNYTIDYNALKEMPYLQACLMECTRLEPFLPRLERVCTKDFKSPDHGIEFRKRQVVHIPIYAANRNPKYFDDPENFKPDRFLEENRKKLCRFAWTSFGFGPKACVSVSFSLQLMMMQALYLLRDFKFHLRSDSKPTYYSTGPHFMIEKKFYFDVTLRK